MTRRRGFNLRDVASAIRPGLLVSLPESVKQPKPRRSKNPLQSEPNGAESCGKESRKPSIFEHEDET